MRLRSLTGDVFRRYAHVRRYEGQTRADNLPMRRTFLRAGWVKEAPYREGSPVAGAEPVDSVGYAILHRDAEEGTSIPVDGDDEV